MAGVRAEPRSLLIPGRKPYKRLLWSACESFGAAANATEWNLL
jgi:hypothetical protein